MDVQTLFFAIAAASGVFGLLLLTLERWTVRDDRLAFMAFGFLLMSAGAFLQFGRDVLPAWLSIGVGNALAIVGLSYQLWAVLAVVGRPVSRTVRVAGILGLCALTGAALALPMGQRSVVAAVAYGGMFALAAVALLTWSGGSRVLRCVVAGLFLADAALYAARAVEVMSGAAPAVLFGQQGSFVTTALYAMLLVTTLATGFGVLLFVKRQSDENLERAAAELNATMATLPTGVLIIRDGLIERANPALAQIVQIPEAELVGTPAPRLHPPEGSLDGILAALFGPDAPGRYTGEVELIRADGRRFWALLEAGVVAGGDRAVVAVTDISEMKRLQAELVRRADFDELTGLPSRASFFQRARAELRRSERARQPVSVAVFDLDRLKEVNDTGGHAAGDIALQRVAAACRESFREADVVGRIGGDEFAALLPDSTLGQASAALQRLLDSVGRGPLVDSEFWIDLSLSVGVAEAEPGESLDDLLARADRLMYQAKAGGGAGWSRPARTPTSGAPEPRPGRSRQPFAAPRTMRAAWYCPQPGRGSVVLPRSQAVGESSRRRGVAAGQPHPHAGVMSELTVTVPVAAPADRVWDALTDWESQGDWMLGTTVRLVGQQRRGVGDRFEAFTGIGPLGFLDTMVVTDWVEGVEVTVAHTGKIVRGSGTFRVEPDGPDDSAVVWIENLSIPGGRVGEVLWRLTRPISKWAVVHSLRRFAATVEGASVPAAA